MKNRYVLKNKKRFYSIIITLSVIIMTTFFTTAAYGYEETKFDLVQVKKGDTLWSMASKCQKNTDIRKVIFEIKKANNLTESIIYEGDYMLIPQ
jgi:cell division protein YceG involved in septum cleavage